jgi:hypothetical protein
MKPQVGCKGRDLVISIEEAELPIEAQAAVRLRCPKKARQLNQKVGCILSWVPQLAETRRWLLTANGYTVMSLIGGDGIRQLDGIEEADLLVLAHSVPVEEKQRAIKLFKGICGSPVLSLLAPHRTKLPEADYSVEALNPDEFLATVKNILAAGSR